MPQGKGHVYVRYAHTDAAKQAKETLPGKYLGGKKIKYVNFSTLWSEEEEVCVCVCVCVCVERERERNDIKRWMYKKKLLLSL
jgi:hypothetical protein